MIEFVDALSFRKLVADFNLEFVCSTSRDFYCASLWGCLSYEG